eukprot:402932-Prymnesium_polylepis.1
MKSRGTVRTASATMPRGNQHTNGGLWPMMRRVAVSDGTRRGQLTYGRYEDASQRRGARRTDETTSEMRASQGAVGCSH